MPIDRTAFCAGNFSDADSKSTGASLSYKERLEWNFRMTRAMVGDVRFDKTSFSTRRFK